MFQSNNFSAFFFLLVVLIKFSFAKKNVLFILLDDFRPAINALGDIKSVTPNIDKLVQNSYVFENVFVQVMPFNL